MPRDFAASMREALGATRASEPDKATRIIQEALSGAPADTAPPTAPRRKTLFGGLGNTIRTLREGRAKFTAPRLRPPPADLPDDAQFPLRTYSGPAGSRDYRLYIPSGDPVGVILMLHGCTQSPDDFATGTGMNAIAEKHRLLVAYPGQTRAHNANACWNWFDPTHQQHGIGEPAILAGITREVMAEFGTERAFVAGLSAGGAMAAVLAETHPNLFAAAGIHSGLGFGSADSVMSAFSAMKGNGAAVAAPRIPAIVFHGSADGTVHASNADRIVGGAATTPDSFTDGGRHVVRKIATATEDRPALEHWSIEGAGHSWSGGQNGGSYTDPTGPDASAEMVRFFLSQKNDKRW